MVVNAVPPQRSIFQREPVRVLSAIGTFAAAINVVLLASEVYEGKIAALVTGLIGAALALGNELFTRSEVVPVHPLEDLARASAATTIIPPVVGGAPLP